MGIVSVVRTSLVFVRHTTSAIMSTPKLIYFPLRGRGEVLRLFFAYQKVAYEEVAPDYQQMKAEGGSEQFPFGQCPIYQEGELILSQMDTILRYLARKYNLYGSSDVERAQIDHVLGGVESIRTLYTGLIYQGGLEPEAKANYKREHISEEGIAIRNGGAHFQYLENLLKRNNGGNQWAVGNSFSIADLQLFDIVSLHLREALFPEEMKGFPLLMGLHDRVAALPGIAEYLSSDKRLPKINGNTLG